MNQLYTRRNIIAGLTIFLALVSFFVWHTFRNMEKTGNETRIVNTRLQSLQVMEKLMDDMQDIETSNRGYVLSGDTQFLVPYYLALKDLKQDTALFKDLYPIFPERKKLLEGLLQIAKRKIDFSVSSVDQLTANHDSVYRQVQSGKGRQIMDSIRQIVFTLENEDRKVLQLSNTQRGISAAVTAKLFAVLAVFFILILILLFLRLRRNLKRRGISEKKISYLADIVEQASDAIMSGDNDFNIVSWNKGAEEMYGYAKEEAIGKKYHTLLDSCRTDDERQKIVEILKAKGYYSEELVYNRKNGQSITVQVSFTAIRDKYNVITGCSIVHRDITERKKTEKLLLEFNEKLNNQVQEKMIEIKEALDRFNIITRATNDVVWEADLKSGTVWWNENFCEKFGYTINDTTTNPHFWDDHIHPDDKDRVLGHINYILSNTNADGWSSEYRFMKADNAYVNIYDRSYVMRDDEGKAYKMIGSMADVSDLFMARKELYESEEKYRTLVEQATDAIFLSDGDGKFILVNSSCCKLSKYTKDELMSMSVYDLVDKDDLARHPFHFAELREGKNVFTERIFKTKEGPLVQVEVNARMLGNGRMLAFIRDITERKKAEEAVKKSEIYLRGTLDATNDGILTIDNNGKVVDANNRFAELWRIPAELMQKKDDNALINYVLDQLIDPEKFLSKVTELYQSDREDFDTLTFRDKRIFERYSTPLILNENIVGRVWSFRDITERKQAEANQQRQFDELQQLYNLSVLIDRESDIEKIYGYAMKSLLTGVKADRCSILLFDNNGSMRFRVSDGLSESYMKEAEGYSPWKVDTDNLDPIFVADITESPGPGALKDVTLKEGIRSLGFIPLLFHGKIIGQFMIYYNELHIFSDNEVQFSRTVAHNIAFSIERNRSNEALLASENRYHSLVEQAADAIVLFDNKGKIIEVNNSALYLLGYSYEELTNMSLAGILTHDEMINNPVQYELLKKGTSTLKQRKMRRKDGSIVIAEVNSKILPDGRFLSMIRDLTDRIEAQKQIEREKELSDHIIDSLPGVFYFFDANGKFIRWNKQFEIVTGYTAKEISEMHPLQFFEDGDIKYIEERIRKVFSEGVSDAEANFVFKDRSRKPYYFKAIVMDFDDRSCLLGTGFDISDSKKAEKELNDSYREIRKLIRHLQNVREEDRAHIAREIHDELGQQLTVLKMDISWVNKKIGNADDVVKQRMKELLKMLDDTVNTVRRISSELRPSLLDDLGLIAAIDWQLQEFKKRSDIKTTFTAPEKEIELPDMVKTGLFRIFQESLTNIIRHSEAKKLDVSLAHVENNFVLTIGDDGKGFDTEKMANKRTLGILGMKERTSMIGGTFEITSTSGEGTIVVVSIPMNGLQ